MNKAGCPRTTTPESDEEIIRLGEDLLRWVKAPKEEGEMPGDKLRFADWFTLEHNMILKEWKALKKVSLFRPYYEQAKAILARKATNGGLDGFVKEGIAHRFMRHYCDEIREAEDNKTLFEAQAKKKADDEVTQRIIIEKDDQLVKLTAELMKAREMIEELRKESCATEIKNQLDEARASSI